MTQLGLLNSRLAKWALLLSQYDMKFVPQKVVKGQAIVDFLVDHPVPENSKLYEAIFDEAMIMNITSQHEVWKMFFDGYERMRPKGKVIAKAGIVFISTKNDALPYPYLLTELCSNNVADYNALIIRMQIAEETRIKYLKAYDDSNLVINQVKGKYDNEDLILYHQATICLAEKFQGFFVDYVPRRIIHMKMF